MNVNLPFPTYEDIRKALQFWVDQQDKWFYFETAASQNRSWGQTEVPNPLQQRTMTSHSYREETIYYLQTRIVGKIGDVIEFPPSLMLNDAEAFTVEFSRSQSYTNTRIVAKESRDKYGLVFSVITYYEPVGDYEAFIEEDQRVNPSD